MKVKEGEEKGSEERIGGLRSRKVILTKLANKGSPLLLVSTNKCRR